MRTLCTEEGVRFDRYKTDDIFFSHIIMPKRGKKKTYDLLFSLWFFFSSIVHLQYVFAKFERVLRVNFYCHRSPARCKNTKKKKLSVVHISSNT